VEIPASCPLWNRYLLTDPQTSGGLLVACSPEVASSVLDIFREEGFDRATVIGRFERGDPGITIT
jgi:selenide,water dikinase